MESTPAQKPDQGCIIGHLPTRSKTMMTKGQKKVGKVMSEFKAGKLTSSGKTVKNPQQAMAIALSSRPMPMRGQRTATNKGKK